MKIKEKGKAADKRAHGVLMEDLDAKLDLVLEGHSALDKKIDLHHEKFVEFKEETNFKFGIVFEKFGEIGGKFDGIDGRFDRVEGRLDKIDGALRDIRNELNNKVDRTEFESFRKEFGVLKGA